jgi:hypothetical protein
VDLKKDFGAPERALGFSRHSYARAQSAKQPGNSGRRSVHRNAGRRAANHQPPSRDDPSSHSIAGACIEDPPLYPLQGSPLPLCVQSRLRWFFQVSLSAAGSRKMGCPFRIGLFSHALRLQACCTGPARNYRVECIASYYLLLSACLILTAARNVITLLYVRDAWIPSDRDVRFPHLAYSKVNISGCLDPVVWERISLSNG